MAVIHAQNGCAFDFGEGEDGEGNSEDDDVEDDSDDDNEQGIDEQFLALLADAEKAGNLKRDATMRTLGITEHEADTLLTMRVYYAAVEVRCTHKIYIYSIPQ